jgi:asparagine synthase (glutamine-hydrolysing)
MQSIADIDVGAFLSGGIDSSSAVALMFQTTSSRVRTFSVGMPDGDLDKSVHAARVASHLGTKYVTYQITLDDALSLIPKLATVWDEPFADSSQIPTLLVCQLARQQVSVALSGDGGDELFLGCAQYPILQQIWKLRQLRHFPWAVTLGIISAAGSMRLQRRAMQAQRKTAQT